MRFVAGFIALILSIWHGLAGLSQLWEGLWTLVLFAELAMPEDKFWNMELLYLTYTHGWWMGPLNIVAGLARLLPAIGLLAGAGVYVASGRRGTLLAFDALLLVGTAGVLLYDNALSLLFKETYDITLMLYWGDVQGYQLAYTLAPFRFLFAAGIDALLFGVTVILAGLLVVAARPADDPEGGE